MFVIDTIEPLSPTREVQEEAAIVASQTAESALDSQQLPSRTLQSPEMENLKRKLSSTRRPETASRNLLPELNQFKQNNVALQYVDSCSLLSTCVPIADRTCAQEADRIAHGEAERVKAE